MDGRREDEHSMFETSHVLGAHLASSPLLPQAWRQCALANTGGAAFLVEDVSGILYVAFPAVQALQFSITSGGAFFGTERIDSGGHGLFSPLAGDKDEDPVLVHASSLHLFLSIYNTPEFQRLITETRNRAVVFTGHSMGGSLASLAALHFLCSSSAPTLCVTFGAPLLGGKALSRAVLRERLAGNFCHVVAQHDVIPRLLFCPPSTISPQLLTSLLQTWQFSMRCPQFSSLQPLYEEKQRLHLFVSMHIAAAAAKGQNQSATAEEKGWYWPFGSYVLCSTEGAVCIDSPEVAVRMLYLTFIAGSASSGVEDENLSYGSLIQRISELLLLKKTIAAAEEASLSNYSTSISLALEASGISMQDMAALEARECLKMSRTMGRTPNLNCAKLAVKLAQITPCRAQIEWYKASCDDTTGYYDSFKCRKASKRESKINMNRIKLGRFWDDVVEMLERNELPHDLHRRAKWVNAAHFYKLLVEPLDIAEYYRGCCGGRDYVRHGRERRYQVFDKWWREKQEEGGVSKRSKFAGLTQDSCFWARVEEARGWAEDARRAEMGRGEMRWLWERLWGFECYAKGMIERKEVSRDVVAPGSSYSLWVVEWEGLKVSMGLQMPP